jgi:predicted  nucleic acid-binding Zn-ribbon protein
MNDRLKQLRSELEKGRQRMQTLDRERENVRETMLRISGAIQVLEELMEEEANTATQLATVA